MSLRPLRHVFVLLLEPLLEPPRAQWYGNDRRQTSDESQPTPAPTLAIVTHSTAVNKSHD
jgi:hypothetical protein